jgi:hypothetical protein
VYLALLHVSGQAVAAPVIPEKSGWSGELTMGAGAGSAKTNMMDGLGGIEVGDDRAVGFDDAANSENFAFPMVRFDLNYTIADYGTQFYLRNEPVPHVFLDLEAQGGLRQHIPGIGIVDVALSSSVPATKIWKDPYLLTGERGDTERSVAGATLQWHNVMETPLAADVSSREIDIDDEESGASLPLDADSRRLLRRTGEVYRYQLRYDWKLGDRHTLVPGISYLDYRLDGDAMAEDGLAVDLQHQYTGARWKLFSSVYFRRLDADAKNPAFGEFADRDVLGVTLNAMRPKPFGLKNWTATVRVSWYESDSDIDFYDESLGTFVLGATYRID